MKSSSIAHKVNKQVKAKVKDKGNIAVISRKAFPAGVDSKQSGMNKTRSAKQLAPSKSGEMISAQQQTLELTFHQRRNMLKAQKMQNNEHENSQKDLKIDSMLDKINNVGEVKGKLSVFYKNAPTKNISK